MDSYKLMKTAFIGAFGVGLFAACTGSGIIYEMTPHLPEEAQSAVHQFRYGIKKMRGYLSGDTENIDLVEFLFKLNESGVANDLTEFGQGLGKKIGIRGIDSLLDALDGD